MQRAVRNRPRRALRRFPPAKARLQCPSPSPASGSTATCSSRARRSASAPASAGAVVAGSDTLPIVGFAIGPVFEHKHHHEVDLGPIENFKEGQFVISTFMLDPSQGEITRRTAYIRNNGF